ncbi:Sec-independent protein translocase protein TatB [Roseomonas sp. AR75]|uniref:Sec-independent protein translocase protein TatB n=1 Tax=Roseomonas sp. AR75 TaxID=2562311 RepID=UPI0010C06055|nr:Sec-independent protein translocase protein TatB [Roseomonas sp. AR75]
MLGLDWTELALIAVVAVVVIGPKDLPEAVRGVAKGIQKLRRMAGEFQGQLDEVVREAKLEDVRSQINEIRNFDFRGAVEREVDKDGSLRQTFNEDPIGNPLKDAFDDRPPPAHGAAVTPPPESPAAGPEEPAAQPPQPVAAPAFVPPGIAAATPPPPASPPPASPPPPPSPVTAAPPPAGASGPAA